MDLTPASLQVFFTGLNTMYELGYAMPAPWAMEVAMQVPSDTELETFGWMDRIPKMREWVGPRHINNVALRSRSLTNHDWELTETIPRNKFLDDKLGLYAPIAKNMGWQAAKLHDQQLALKIQENPVCFDGLTFFNDAHLTNIDDVGSSTYDNNLALPLTPTNFGTARASMRSFKGRDGQPIGSNPTLLVVPPSLTDMALTITQAENIAAFVAGSVVAGNVGTTTNIYRGSIKVLTIAELENQPTSWYLLDNEGIIKPFLVQVRQAANFVYLNNPTDPNVFWRKEFIFGVDSRSAYDVTLPFKALRSTG
jgi:phage major head subunit gpT-like protein